MRIKEFVEKCRVSLVGGGTGYSAEEVRSLTIRILHDVWGFANHSLVTEPEAEIPAREAECERIIERLGRGEPLQYIVGWELFCGEKFKVGPGVLIPRPETEELVSLIVLSNSAIKPHRILDFCTGSGCIAWSLWKYFRYAEVYGCDISGKALRCARSQEITRMGSETEDMPVSLRDFGNRYKREPLFFKCDLLSEKVFETRLFKRLSSVKTDIIVCNPPYVLQKERSYMRKNVLDYEPLEALFVSDDTPLLFYRRVAEISKYIIDKKGRIYFEVNENYAPEVASVLSELGYAQPQVVTDIAGKQRFVRAIKG